MKAKLNFKKDFRTISENETISKAVSLFKKEKRSLVVKDKNGTYSGILTEKDVLRSATSVESTKVDSLKINAPKISEETSLSKCARLMIENDILVLPVFRNQEIIGVIEDIHILKNLPKDIVNSNTRRYMSDNLIVTTPYEKISVVMAELRENQISRMPVTENSKIIGIITIHDFVTKSFLPKKRQNLGYLMDERKPVMDLPVKNFMTSPVITDYENAKIKSIVDKLIEHEINSIMIIDKRNRLKGIITRKDLLEPFAQTDHEVEVPQIYVSSKIGNLDRKSIADSIAKYSEKSKHLLKRSVFNVYITEHKESFREQKHDRLYVRLRVHSPAGRFVAAAHGWGVDNMMKNALEKIDRQIEKKLNLSNITETKKI
ncbi:CBS domain-containing protein [Candidatus Woesearchaeota archaeon]|nr:CBS domain-containing protein [Candidatus Woesearchaeota archaeon]